MDWETLLTSLGISPANALGYGGGGIEPPAAPEAPIPALTAAVPPPPAPPAAAPPSGGGGGPFAGGAPASLFPWLTTPGEGTPTVPVPSATPAGPAGAPGPQPPAAPTQTAQADRILASLRGVQAPPRPEYQKVTTPHPPVVPHLQGGQLINMLASLGITPQMLPQLGRRV